MQYTSSNAFQNTYRYMKKKIENLFNSLDGKSLFVQDVIGRRSVEGVNKTCISGAGFDDMNLPARLEATDASTPRKEKLSISRTIQ